MSLHANALAPLSGYAFGTGGLLICAALAGLWMGRTSTSATGGATTFKGGGFAIDWGRSWLLPLMVIVAVGAVLRLYDIDTKSLSHPEVYIPTIPLPGGISEPPPRHDFLDTLSWHYHSEIHPPGYYMAMWAWTKIFGTGVISLRITSALLGIVSLALIFRVGSLLYDRNVGLIAAAMLALNGFHMYWSDMARMYVPGSFLGLLATWLFLELVRAAQPRPFIEAAYVATAIAGVSTQIFFWPFLGMHVLWLMLSHDGLQRKIYRLAYVQALALILSAPLLTHVIYMTREVPVPGPSLRFMVEYFSFGFLFEADLLTEPARVLPDWAMLVPLAIAVGLFIRGLFVRTAKVSHDAAWMAPAIWPLILAAVGSATVMVAMALVAHSRNAVLLALSVLPILFLAGPSLIAALGGRIGAGLHDIRLPIVGAPALTGLCALLAVVPAVVIFAASYWKPLLASRAFLIFVPYLLIVIGAGIRALGRRAVPATVLTICLGALMAASVWHFKATPGSKRDYQVIGMGMIARMMPNDLILVQPGDWRTTPLYYYLGQRHYVAGDYAASVAARPEARAWVVLFDPQEPTMEMALALDQGFTAVDEVQALRGQSRLYARGPAPVAPVQAALAANGGPYRVSAAGLLDGESGHEGTRYEQVRDVAIDRAGNIYLVGGTPSADFPVTAGAFDTSFNDGGDGLGTFGDMDVFVAKLSPTGEIVWSTYLGGPNYDRAYAVSVDEEGFVYVAGRAGEGFPTTPGALQQRFAGDDAGPDAGYGQQDGFVTKLKSDGSGLVWSTYFGDPGHGFIRDIDIDGEGQIHIAATHVSQPLAYITADAAQPRLAGSADAVYARLSADGARITYATYYGGHDDGAEGDGTNPSIRVDGQGGAYFLAYTTSDHLPVTQSAFQTRRAGGADLMLAKFGRDGQLIFSTYLGGSGNDDLETNNLALDTEGNPIVAGITRSNDFPVTAAALQHRLRDVDVLSGDGFVAKLSADGTRLLAASYLGGGERDEVEGIQVTPAGEILVTGGTYSADFPVTEDAVQSRRGGRSDIFVAKLAADLSRVIYGTFIGGGSRDEGRCVALGPEGEIVVGGHSMSIDFPAVNAFDTRLNGNWSGTYVKLSP